MMKKVVLTILFTVVFVSGCAINRYPGEADMSSIAKAPAELVSSEKHADSPWRDRERNGSKGPVIQTGRYSVIRAKPTEAQRELLQVVIEMTLPKTVATIREAVDYLLRRSGYARLNGGAQDLKVSGMLSKRLPDVHRRLGPMTLEDALAVLAGPAFVLQEDPVHRRIRYRVLAKQDKGAKT